VQIAREPIRLSRKYTFGKNDDEACYHFGRVTTFSPGEASNRAKLIPDRGGWIVTARPESDDAGTCYLSLSGVVVVPLKANVDRRLHIPKQWQRATNSAAYNSGLRQSGRLTVWFAAAAIAAWRSRRR
jgi:hypothetical protein